MNADAELARALRALGRSGRRLVRRASGWAVIGGTDGRARPVAELAEATALRLLELRRLRPAEGGGYVLCEGGIATDAPGAGVVGPGVLVAAGRPRSRRTGAGFAALAQRAAEGDGPLTLRQAHAGLRLTADAEAAARDPALSMGWDGVPGARGRRGGARAASPRPGEHARARLQRIKARAGERAFALAHSACVEGRTLGDLEARFGLAKRGGAAALAEALERIAAGYEG